MYSPVLQWDDVIIMVYIYIMYRQDLRFSMRDTLNPTYTYQQDYEYPTLTIGRIGQNGYRIHKLHLDSVPLRFTSVVSPLLCNTLSRTFCYSLNYMPPPLRGCSKIEEQLRYIYSYMYAENQQQCWPSLYHQSSTLYVPKIGSEITCIDIVCGDWR